MNPEKIYHEIIIVGPLQPTSSASLRENNRISNKGLVKFEYIKDNEFAHFSISVVRR
jgi:hypothetical protein